MAVCWKGATGRERQAVSMAKDTAASAGKHEKATMKKKPKGKNAAQPPKMFSREGHTDSRFTAMHSDPRFKRFPKKANKVEIDSRFAGMFTEERFQVRGAVDKRGRKGEDFEEQGGHAAVLSPSC